MCMIALWGCVMANKPVKEKSEHVEQVEFFRWCAEVAYAGFDLVVGNAPKPYADHLRHPIKSLKLIHAIPNGGARGNDGRTNMIRGAMLKAEGVRKGVPDIFLPFPCGSYHGLYIEMKVADRTKGRVSQEQTDFMNEVMQLGYCCEVCYGAEEAKQAVMKYYGYKV